MSLAYRLVRKVGYLLRLRLEIEPSWVWRMAMALLAGLMRLHGWTLRYSVDDKAGYLEGRADPVIALLWHNRIFSLPPLYERRYCKQRRALVLTSAGPEGSLLALVLAHFGIGAVRGSTSRRSSVALREMAMLLTEGNDLMITPDGPRGPRYRLQPGALYLAQKTGCAILPVHVEFSHYRRFRTWDGFAIALPFARVRVVIDEPFWIDASATDEELETQRLRLERIMTESLVMDRVDSAA